MELGEEFFFSVVIWWRKLFFTLQSLL